MSALLTILAAGEPSQPSAPSNYMPSVRVEIAFNAGQRTPASLYTWTDVTDYVELAEGITITGGRQDERSTADANQLTLTLDNSDGRFTFGKTTGPYGSAVKLDRPIRVIADPVDGTESVRFLGYINEWPTEWNGTDAYAKATITASSRISRMGYTAKLPNIISQTILADSPIAYYTMGEPSGATQANDSSGNLADPLTMTGIGDAVAFGSATGPATDGLTAAQFNAVTTEVTGQFLAGATPSVAASIECFFLVSAAPTEDAWLLDYGIDEIRLSIAKTTGQLQLNGSSVAATNVADNATHHVVVTFSGGLAHVYLDSSNVANPATTAPTTTRVSAGGSGSTNGSIKFNLNGVIAHLAFYSTVLNSTQVTAHYTAGTTGFAGEALDVRADRYAAIAGIAATEVNAEASNVTVQHIDTTDKQIIELLRVLETTEAGVLYDERDGTLTLHNRTHRYVTASSFTLDMAQQHIEADYRPTVDRSFIVNDVSAKDISGLYTAHAFDTQSRDVDYGLVRAEVETASTDDEAPLNHASWLVAAYKDPRTRVPSLTVDALSQGGKTPNCATVMAATVGTKITVSNHPSQAAGSSASYFVEGWTEAYGPESLRITWNLSPSAPWDQVLVIGDSTRGVIGTNPVAF